MRKVIIIGGGAAGLSLAIGLKKIGMTVKIFEKREKNHNNGLALLLLPNGFEVLKKMGLDREILKKASPLCNFVSQYSNGKQIQSKPMSNLFGVKRSDVLEILRIELSNEDIFYEHEFSHFRFDEYGNAIAVQFTNGHLEKGDFFIGADGVHSIIRKSLFPNNTISKTNVTEIVSLIKAPDLSKKLDNTFIKTICKAGARAVGVLPCSPKDIVWFFQFDETMINFDQGCDDIRSFLIHQLSSWTSPVKELLIRTDFSKSYLWKTHDLNSLPAYHRKNIALIGDAAHVFATFTSQGLNAALEDGYCLANLFATRTPQTPVSKIFEMYFQQRNETAENYLEYGRELKNQFLETQYQIGEVTVPMAF